MLRSLSKNRTLRYKLTREPNKPTGFPVFWQPFGGQARRKVQYVCSCFLSKDMVVTPQR